ncbi:S8 family peptidase [Natronococcus pandeyae]|nr:S8 family serine peptidase [Natronococcus pandeyae]
MVVATGFASASDGQARYLARTNGRSGDLEAAGFAVLNELAAGELLLATGPEDAVDDLEDVRGVTAAVRDVALEIEPVAEENGYDGGLPDDPDEVYDEVLWDKQKQAVREAQAHATGDGATVAVIDTGVDEDHPDLSNLDTEQSARIDDGRLEPHEGDPHGHGTHVAGTAAATGDAHMLGTAPDARLVSVDVLGHGTGTFGDIMVGMEHAADVGADAANISLGYMVAPQEFADVTENPGAYRRMFEPVANYGQRNGTLYVGSGGNDETDLQGGWLRLWNGLSGVIGVSATTPDDGLTFYSNYGRNDIDVGAPGGGYEELIPETYCGYAEWVSAGTPMTPTDVPVEPGEETKVCFDEDGSIVVATDEDDEAAEECIPCTIPEWPYPFNFVFSTYVPSEGDDGDEPAYAWLAGTSMAAPQVTGLAALVRELEPDAGPQQVHQAIRSGAEAVESRGDPELGAGRVNALHTVERVIDE